MVKEKLSVQKESYQKAEIEVILFSAEDVVTASPAGTALAEYNKGDGTSTDANNYYWWN